MDHKAQICRWSGCDVQPAISTKIKIASGRFYTDEQSTKKLAGEEE
jgi:hypothetical protein